MYRLKQRAIQNDIESQTSQRAEVIKDIAVTHITSKELIKNIIGNGYTDSATLEYIAVYYCDANNKIDGVVRAKVLELLAQRADLTVKASYLLVHVKSQKVARKLSQSTKYEVIQKILLKRNSDDEIVIGNIIRNTHSIVLINKCIDIIVGDDVSEAGNAVVKNSNYILTGIYLNEFLTEKELKRLIDAKKIIPKRLLEHASCNKEIFEYLMTVLKFEDLLNFKGLAEAIVASPFIGDYPNIVNVVAKSNLICTKKVVSAIISNPYFPKAYSYSVVERFKDMVVSDKKMLTRALELCDTEKEIDNLLNVADIVYGCHIKTVFAKKFKLTKKTYELLSEKVSRKEYSSIKVYMDYVPEKYWAILYCRATAKMAQYILEKANCPKELLLMVTSRSRAYSVVKAVALNPCTDVEIALKIFDIIKYAESMSFRCRASIWQILEERFSTDFTDRLLSQDLKDRQLYCMYLMSCNLELKCKIAMCISGVPLQHMVDAAEKNGTSFKEALLQNPSVDILQRRMLQINYTDLD